jgi:hypothetical protein
LLDDTVCSVGCCDAFENGDCLTLVGYVNREGENERKFLLIIFQQISQCRPEYNLLREDTLCKSLSSLLVA